MTKIIFPQANNLDVIKSVLIIIYNKPGIKDTNIAEKINYHPRQGSYYTSACTYFNLINSINGENYLTELGYSLFDEYDEFILSKLYAIILQDPIISDVYVNFILGNITDIRDYSEMLLSKYFNYQESVAKRRASTINKWIIDIMGYIKSTDKGKIKYTLNQGH